MNINEELERRIKFLEFLEINGLNYKTDKRIFEISPDINQSISKLLIEKYGKLYKPFLVSKKFKYDNKSKIQGLRGEVNYYSSDFTFDIPKTNLNEKNIPRKIFTKKYKLPKEIDFDTLIIYGLRNKMHEFENCIIKRKFLGEIYKGTPKKLNINDYYYSMIMTYLNFKYYKEYQFIEEYDSKNNETYLLIKKK